MKTPATTTSIIAQIAEIQRLALPELRERWMALYGTEAPNYSRQHLVKRVCYRLQELKFGGLSDATRATLRAIAERETPDGQLRPLARRNANVGGPVPGTVFVREWHGERHEVTVLMEGSLEYAGAKYRSLSAIAKRITGAHWNGRLFFGLHNRKGRDA